MPVGTMIAAGIRFEDVALKDLKLYMMLFDLSVIENRKFAIFQSSCWSKKCVLRAWESKLRATLLLMKPKIGLKSEFESWFLKKKKIREINIFIKEFAFFFCQINGRMNLCKTAETI